MILIALTITCLIFVSCNGEVTDCSKTKVHIISVGLDYYNTELVNENGMAQPGYMHLEGAVNSAVEVGLCLDDIYTAKDIDHDLTLMISYSPSASVQKTKNYPTARKVIDKINSLSVSQNDLIVFYFSGHTYRNGQMVLARENQEQTHTILEANELYEALNNKGCASIAILDTCHAGTVPEFGTGGQYLNQVAQSFLKQDFPHVSVIAACSPAQDAIYDQARDSHGYFTLALLQVLGWNHNPQKPATRNKGFGNAIGSFSGCVEKEIAQLSTDDLFEQIISIWPEITATGYDNSNEDAKKQTPVKTFDHAKFMLIPETDRFSLPEIDTEHASDTVIVSDGVNERYYASIQDAIDAILNGEIEGTIYLIKDIKDSESITINLKVSVVKEIDIECGTHKVEFGNTKGIEISGEGDVNISGGKFSNSDTTISDGASVILDTISLDGDLELDNATVSVEKGDFNLKKVTVDEDSSLFFTETELIINNGEIKGKVEIEGGSVEFVKTPTVTEKENLTIKDSTIYATDEAFEKLREIATVSDDCTKEEFRAIGGGGFVIDLPTDPNLKE